MSKMTSSDGSYVRWISWFSGTRGNEWFVEVEENFIKDDFALTGLFDQVSHFRKAINLILDLADHDGEEEDDSGADVILEDATHLYGLIHARYILTGKGMKKMVEKFETAEFGTCPRVMCEDQAVLPIGMSDIPGEKMVKVYCPKCQDIYTPIHSRHQHIDGAYFGTGFPHAFFMEHPEMRPKPPTKTFDARLYGFKIHPLAYELQYQAAAMSNEAQKTGRIQRMK